MFLALDDVAWDPDPPQVDDAEAAMLVIAAIQVDQAWVANWLRSRTRFPTPEPRTARMTIHLWNAVKGASAVSPGTTQRTACSVTDTTYHEPMNWLRGVFGAYLAVAVTTRLAEIAGLHRCGCAVDCWCKCPVLSTFRWVFPYGHRAVDPREKGTLAAA